MITIGGQDLLALIPDATDLLERALKDGLDPTADPHRVGIDVPAGQLLLMPSSFGGHTGLKIVGVAPGNPARGVPRIQASYLLMDAQTLVPQALIDGVALTSLRTPAISALAVRHLLGTDARRLVVFGTGPQAWGHVLALRKEMPLETVEVVGRTAAGDFADRCRRIGLNARTATPKIVEHADVIVCATTAREPLFRGALVPGHAVVVAVGSHEPDAREVDDALVARSTVVVEDRETALREAGDIMIPLRSGMVPPDHIAADLRDLVTGRFEPPHDRPAFFKSVGMAWQDLVIAAAAHQRITET